MTDRYFALTVVLDKDIREDDAQPILDAIKMVKGVLDVKGLVSSPDTWMAEERARVDIGRKIMKIFSSTDKE